MALDRIGAEAQERAMRVLLCAFLLLASLLPAAAQQTEGAPPPYEADLMHLAEILGAPHYLRPLCGAPNEGQSWRTEMQTLIDAEQPSDPRKGKLIASGTMDEVKGDQLLEAVFLELEGEKNA